MKPMSLFRLPALILLVASNFAPAFAATAPDPAPDLHAEKLLSGSWLPGEIMASARQADGKILLGGVFNRVSGSIARTHLLRLNRDGTLDADFAPVFFSDTAMQVSALATNGDAIYAGGIFLTVNGANRYSIVKLHLDGTLYTEWTSPFSNPSFNAVNAIVATEAGVFVAGDLLDHDAWGIARLDPATGAFDTAWSAQMQFSPTATPNSGNRGEGNALLAIGNDLIVGGSFGQIAGVARTGVARISQSAPVVVRAFDGGISGTVRALARSGNGLYVGGDFFRATPPGAGYLNRLNIDTGALDFNWSPDTFGSVYALHVVVDTLYAGGSFTAATTGGARLARFPLNGDGSVDQSWNPSVDDTVYALSDTCHGNLLVGGSFETISNATRYGMAAFGVPQIDCLFADGFEGD